MEHKSEIEIEGIGVFQKTVDEYSPDEYRVTVTKKENPDYLIAASYIIGSYVLEIKTINCDLNNYNEKDVLIKILLQEGKRHKKTMVRINFNQWNARTFQNVFEKNGFEITECTLWIFSASKGIANI